MKNILIAHGLITVEQAKEYSDSKLDEVTNMYFASPFNAAIESYPEKYKDCKQLILQAMIDAIDLKELYNLHTLQLNLAILIFKHCLFYSKGLVVVSDFSEENGVILPKRTFMSCEVKKTSPKENTITLETVIKEFLKPCLPPESLVRNTSSNSLMANAIHRVSSK